MGLELAFQIVSGCRWSEWGGGAHAATTRAGSTLIKAEKKWRRQFEGGDGPGHDDGPQQEICRTTYQGTRTKGQSF